MRRLIPVILALLVCGSVMADQHMEQSLYKRLGGYPYDQDPNRPGWSPTIPNNRWANPADDRTPKIAF